MSMDNFEYSPLAKGIFTALCWLTFLVLALLTKWLHYYLALLAFLGFGLKPLLIKTGIYRAYSGAMFSVSERWNRKEVAKRREQLRQEERSRRYKHSRVKDPRLPKNW